MDPQPEPVSYICGGTLHFFILTCFFQSSNTLVEIISYQLITELVQTIGLTSDRSSDDVIGGKATDDIICNHELGKRVQGIESYIDDAVQTSKYAWGFGNEILDPYGALVRLKDWICLSTSIGSDFW